MNAVEQPTAAVQPFHILLVEDDPGDVLITREALEQSRLFHRLEVVENGEQALDYMHKRGDYTEAPTPDLVLLDLNLPRVSGSEVLAEVKADPELRRTPVIVLTTSESESDVTTTYGLHANAFITKPVDFERFHEVVRRIDDFFLSVVRLPGRDAN